MITLRHYSLTVLREYLLSPYSHRDIVDELGESLLSWRHAAIRYYARQGVKNRIELMGREIMALRTEIEELKRKVRDK